MNDAYEKTLVDLESDLFDLVSVSTQDPDMVLVITLDEAQSYYDDLKQTLAGTNMYMYQPLRMLLADLYDMLVMDRAVSEPNRELEIGLTRAQVVHPALRSLIFDV